MNDGLIIGYDLCKDFCRVSYYKEGEEEPADVAFSDGGNPYLIQNAICKKRGKDEWLVGQAAYETALLGGGSIVDKLLTLVARKGYSSFEGVRYSAEELFRHFMEESLNLIYEATGKHTITELVFSVQELDAIVLDSIMSTCRALDIPREKVHIVSHTECFLYYVLSRKRDLWSNLSVLYDFSGDGLNYYDLEILRGMQPNAAYAKRRFLEEGFSIDILDKPLGHRIADSILTGCVERTLEKKLVSSCYLSGNGMDNCQVWGNEFLKTLCNRRRVFFVENLFAKGAVYAAMEYIRPESAYPFRIMCEGRIRVDISCDVVRGSSPKTILMAKAGQNWYETKCEFDFIPDQEQSLRLKVRKLNERTPREVEIPFKEIVEGRQNKMTRIAVSLKFTSENTFMVTLKDKGFGEIVPARETAIHPTLTIE